MKIRAGAGDDLALSAREGFSLYLVSGEVSINEFVGLQVVFGGMRIIPASHEELVERDIQGAKILVVFEDVFRHLLDIET